MYALILKFATLILVDAFLYLVVKINYIVKIKRHGSISRHV